LYALWHVLHNNRSHGKNILLLLAHLKEVLGNPITWESKRQVIELLVWEVKINTIIEGSKSKAEATITFAV